MPVAAIVDLERNKSVGAPAKAKTRQIEGRSKMTKQQLQNALH